MIKNELKILMGGEERTLRYSMISSKKMMAALRDPETQAKLEDTVELVIFLIGLGLRDKPKDYSIELLEEWIDDLPMEVISEAKDFALQAMGFMVEAERVTRNRLQGIFQEMEIPAEEATKTKAPKPKIKPSIN